jgi:hypothetical protein
MSDGYLKENMLNLKYSAQLANGDHMNTTQAWVDDYQPKPQVATIANLTVAEDANKSINVKHFRCDADGTSWSGEASCPECGKASALHEHKFGNLEYDRIVRSNSEYAGRHRLLGHRPRK